MAKKFYAPALRSGEMVSREVKKFYVPYLTNDQLLSKKVVKAYCSVVRNGQHVSRLFYEDGGSTENIYRLVLLQDYEVGQTYTFATCDIVELARYSLDKFLYYNKYAFIKDSTLNQLETNYNNIIGYIDNNKGNYNAGKVQITCISGSNPLATVDVTVWLGNIADPTFEVSAKTYQEGSYYYTIPSTSLPFRIYQRINTSGILAQTTSSNSSSLTYVGENDTIPLPYNFLRIETTNLGIEIQEIEESQQEEEGYLAYWDFTSQDPLVDKCRNMLPLYSNGSIDGQGLHISSGYLRLPNIVGMLSSKNTLQVEIIVKGLVPATNASTGALRENRLYSYRSNNGLSIRSTGYWGIYGGSWQMTEVPSSTLPTDCTINISEDGFWNVSFLGEFNYAMNNTTTASGATAQYLGILGSPISGYGFAQGIIESIGIKMKKMDYTDIYYYGSYAFGKSPDGTGVTNNVRRSSYSELAEYFGTNKILICSSKGTSASIPAMEWRSVGDLPRRHIRINTAASEAYEIFIPINRLSKVGNKYMEITCYSFSSGTIPFDFGVAYIDGNTLQVSKSTGSANTTGFVKQNATLTADTVDYLYFAVNSSSAKTLFIDKIILR